MTVSTLKGGGAHILKDYKLLALGDPCLPPHGAVVRIKRKWNCVTMSPRRSHPTVPSVDIEPSRTRAGGLWSKSGSGGRWVRGGAKSLPRSFIKGLISQACLHV